MIPLFNQHPLSFIFAKVQKRSMIQSSHDFVEHTVLFLFPYKAISSGVFCVIASGDDYVSLATFFLPSKFNRATLPSTAVNISFFEINQDNTIKK